MSIQKPIENLTSERRTGSLILFGYKSSGKTFFGKYLAHAVTAPFIDTDLLVEELYEKEFSVAGDCKQISLKLGEAGFRVLEKRVIDNLDSTSAVIALGGGTVLNPENVNKLRQLGLLVYLDVNKEEIKQRIFRQGIPSFLNPKEPEKSFDAMYEERRTIYENISSLSVKIDGKTAVEVLNELLHFWRF